MIDKYLNTLKNLFITGLVTLLPLVVTVYVVWISFNFFDSLFKPVFSQIFEKMGLWYPPGLSLIFTFLIITLLGGIVRVALGRKVVDFFENVVVMRIPWVKSLYRLIQEALNALLNQQGKAYRGVVLVEYPRRGSYTIGLTAERVVKEIQGVTEKDLINVFVPTSPNPTSGYVLMIPRDEVVPLDISMDKALTIIMSGGFSGK